MSAAIPERRTVPAMGHCFGSATPEHGGRHVDEDGLFCSNHIDATNKKCAWHWSIHQDFPRPCEGRQHANRGRPRKVRNDGE